MPGDYRSIVERIAKQHEADKTAGIYHDYANAVKLISEVVFPSSIGFVLELLQNAEDAGSAPPLLPYPGCFIIGLNDERIKISHNGAPFTDKNVEAISGIRSSKKPEQGTLGYLGIGFKSVFKVTDFPQIYSGGFRFGFDKHSRNGEVNALWRVTPVWLDDPTEPIDDALTTIIIPFRNPKVSASLRDAFSKLGPQLYLFLRWIKSIKVVDEVAGTDFTLENLGTDEDNITTLRDRGLVRRFRIFRREVAVPEYVKTDLLTQDYRENVERREIAIGFEVSPSGGLIPSESVASYGGVYSFLPLGESSSGAMFPIQADFLVQPGRDAIQYEAPWNAWLVDEIAALCKDVIAEFVHHEKWRYQILEAFAFKHTKGDDSYEKLFGPHLIRPIEDFLMAAPVIPTRDGALASFTQLVRLAESERASESLVDMGLLTWNDMASILAARKATFVHPSVVDGNWTIESVDRSSLLTNDEYLNTIAASSDAPAWFRNLYLWLNRNPVEMPKGRKKEERRYHSDSIVLTSTNELLTGGKVSYINTKISNPVLVEFAKSWQEGRPLLHPQILVSAGSDEDIKETLGFLQGYTGVQQFDAAKLCRETILPLLDCTKPQLPPELIIEYTRCCYEILDPATLAGLELWVLSKPFEPRAARETVLSTEFKPHPNWEASAKYVPGLRFVSPAYLRVNEMEDLPRWRAFLTKIGVKAETKDSVENFAINYAKEQLREVYTDFVSVEPHDYGYDLEANDRGAGTTIRIEVKGLRDEADIELTGNEAKAAQRYRDAYFLCVVVGIPEHPALYLLQDPERRGFKDKITIPASIWREARW